MGIGNDVSLGRTEEFESAKSDASAAFFSQASFLVADYYHSLDMA